MQCGDEYKASLNENGLSNVTFHMRCIIRMKQTVLPFVCISNIDNVA